MNYDEILENVTKDNNLVKLSNGIVLENKNIEILEKYDINPNSYSSLNELIFSIQNILNTYDLQDDEYDELDLVCSSLAEKNYYLYTNK